MKKVEIYKEDKWNMMHAEIQGRNIVVREISDQWGEETHIFQSRPSLMNWVEHRFAADRFTGSEEERLALIEAFRNL